MDTALLFLCAEGVEKTLNSWITDEHLEVQLLNFFRRFCEFWSLNAVPLTKEMNKAKCKNTQHVWGVV